MKRDLGHSSGYVLGFHGCDRDLAEAVLSGEQDLVESRNNYDWLGQGIYFWEGNLERAQRWAIDRQTMPKSSIAHPYAIGAIIDMGRCFDLMRTDHLEMLKTAHTALQLAWGDGMPQNTGGTDRFLRRLDCAVIQLLHEERKERSAPPFDTVRGLFQEGVPVYEGAGFCSGNHIQICVRNRDCIKGYFCPIMD
ncbi:MAG: hypothetical protein ACI8W8_000510 [Rhodothermales bacterium]|jgi:hypothetical protein